MNVAMQAGCGAGILAANVCKGELNTIQNYTKYTKSWLELDILMP